MRHYQCDSPEAAARVVAACLLSDGHLAKEEIEALHRLGFEKRLSLHPSQFLLVVQNLCEDLTCSAYLSWGDVCQFDPFVIAQLAVDVQSRQLQRDVILLCEEVMHAQGHYSERQVEFLRSLRAVWGSACVHAVPATPAQRMGAQRMHSTGRTDLPR